MTTNPSLVTLNTNLPALFSANQLTQNIFNLNSTIQHLSTGLSINTPADNPTGNAIANRLQGSINVLGQGTLNAQNAVSVAQTAQGGLGQIVSILQQLNTLVAVAAQSTTTTTTRQGIQTQVNSLLAQINQIVGQTQFGNQTLLDGSISAPQAGVGSTLAITNNAYLSSGGTALVSSLNVATVSLLSPVTNASSFLDEAFQITISPSTVSTSSFIINVFASGTIPSNGVPDTSPIATIILSPGAVANNATLIPVTITSSSAGGATFVATLNFQGITISDIANIVGDSAFVSTTAFQPRVTSDKSLLVQVGANPGGTQALFAPSVLTGSLFSNQGINVSTFLQSEGALVQVAHAINVASAAQSTVGVLQTNFQSTTSNNQVLQQNLTAAKSNIVDLDVAQATADLVQQQVLTQSNLSALAQANLLPNLFLSLLPKT